eukprot:3311121-Rhodomonas_salina.1
MSNGRSKSALFTRIGREVDPSLPSACTTTHAKLRSGACSSAAHPPKEVASSSTSEKTEPAAMHILLHAIFRCHFSFQFCGFGTLPPSTITKTPDKAGKERRSSTWICLTCRARRERSNQDRIPPPRGWTEPTRTRAVGQAGVEMGHLALAD